MKRDGGVEFLWRGKRERERERRERESAERERERGREVERESGGNLKTCKKKKVVFLSFFF